MQASALGGNVDRCRQHVHARNQRDNTTLRDVGSGLVETVLIDRPEHEHRVVPGLLPQVGIQAAQQGDGERRLPFELREVESDENPDGMVYEMQLDGKPIAPPDDVKGTMFVDLGGLRAFEGSQNYPIPAGVDLASDVAVGEEHVRQATRGVARRRGGGCGGGCGCCLYRFFTGVYSKDKRRR